MSLLAVVAVLAVGNVVANRFVDDAGYVLWNLGVAATCVVLARRGGVGMSELGLGGTRSAKWAKGLRVGAAIAALVAIVYLVGVALPGTRDLFRDRRVAGDSAARMLFEVFVRIPLGTVVLEEVAFRGVLPVLIARARGVSWRTGAVWASVLFGLWHVLPAWNLAKVNPTTRRFLRAFGSEAAARPVALAFAVIGTAIAGLVLCAIRRWGDHVIASVLVHVSTNSFAYLLAWFVLR